MKNNDFEHEVYYRFKLKYEKLIDKNFKGFYNSLIKDIKKINDKSINEILIRNLKRTIIYTKRNWNKKLINDEKSALNKELTFVNLEYEKVNSGILSNEEFIEKFKKSNINNYKKDIIKKLKEWETNEDILLTEYPYLYDRQKRSIKVAFKNDILKLSIDYFKDVKVTRVPSIIGDIAIDTTNRIDFLNSTDKDKIDMQDYTSFNSTIDKLIYSDVDQQQELLLQLEHETFMKIKNGEGVSNVGDMVTKMAILKTLKTFNNFDKKIILYFYQHFYEVLSGKKIEKYISDIVEELGFKNQTRYRNMVEDSIAKIASMKISYKFKGHSINGVFFEAKIEELEGRKKATVYLSGIIEDVIIKDNTINFYDDLYNNLSADSQQLAVMLQKNRMKLAIEEKGYSENITLMEFSRSIFWGTKRIDIQRKRIISALDELKLKNVVIYDYYYDKKGYCFNIEYIPFNQDNINKIQSREFKYGNIIEGTVYEVHDDIN
ncbi:hypothetical protein [Clostridium tarantellae]|uniref:Uncharacterized protein n=1 Tax=Clostridium tarantellae TaxID=39493 RepID=A0A6I1MRU1_9CLOT|nr:hypothetical protein [Clostridium tarantellae]MPQ44912.1 hypothetical protein [Clostridium tarantellae]